MGVVCVCGAGVKMTLGVDFRAGVEAGMALDMGFLRVSGACAGVSALVAFPVGTEVWELVVGVGEET